MILRQLGPTLSQLALCELAFEHAVLQMIAPISHRLIDFAKPFRVTDIVGNDVGVSHGWLVSKEQNAVRGLKAVSSYCKILLIANNTRHAPTPVSSHLIPNSFPLPPKRYGIHQPQRRSLLCL